MQRNAFLFKLRWNEILHQYFRPHSCFMSNYANLECVSIPWLFAESVSNLWKQSISNYKEDCNWSGPRLSLHEFHVWPLKINLFHAPTLAGKIAKIWHCCRHGIWEDIRHPTQIGTRLSLWYCFATVTIPQNFAWWIAMKRAITFREVYEKRGAQRNIWYLFFYDLAQFFVQESRGLHLPIWSFRCLTCLFEASF